MTSQEKLKECSDLLVRIRDTYLKNHEAEKALITAVVERAMKAEEVDEVLHEKSAKKYGRKKS